MSRSILVNGWNIPVRLADFELSEAARNGEVAQGGIDLDSENAGVDVNSHWVISVQDTAAASNQVFYGYVGDKDIARGPYAIDKDRQFDINTVDLNTLLIDDIITGSSGNRPAETDIARVTWLVGTSFLNGMGATIGASGATNLEAADYRTQNPLALLTQAAETAGKLFFVYWDFATNAPKLFYDLATASNFITSSKISTVLSDGSNALTHHPRKDSLHRTLDGGRIYSGLLFKYDGGSVTVTNTATASNYRARKTVIYDNSVKTSGMATTKADQYLNSVSTPEEVITLDVDLTAAQINEFRAGQLMQIKAPHLGIPTFSDRRIVRKTMRPRGDGDHVDALDYRVTLELSLPKSNQFGARGVPNDVLPSPGITTTANASRTTTGCVGAGTQNYVGANQREHIEGVTGTTYLSGIPSLVASRIYDNVPYTNGDGCAAPYGGWWHYQDSELWYQFTAPADSATYLGLQFDITGINPSGPLRGPVIVAIAPTAPSTSCFGKWFPVGSFNTVTGGTYFFPRNLIRWGQTNSIVLSPAWRCDRPGIFACINDAGGAVATGQFNSGSYPAGDLFLANRCAVIFASGATGLSDWVPGYGETNGSNTLFTLINWDGTGLPTATLNGLDIESDLVSFDTSARTARLATAPVTGSILLFQYNVAA